MRNPVVIGGLPALRFGEESLRRFSVDAWGACGNTVEQAATLPC
jgi:hypothetical protein